MEWLLGGDISLISEHMDICSGNIVIRRIYYTTEQMYVNGVASGSPNVAAGKTSGPSYFSIGGVAGQSFSGYISNVQFYNTSLDASQIQSLYLEGIGGAPVSPQYLVAWWPLNGDTNDYSGNNNNGAPTAVTFISQYGK